MEASQAAGLRNVVFTGWLSAPAIATLLQSAWIGIAAYAPGAPQSLPNKIFEYMSGGLPILSSLGGGTAALLEAESIGFTYRNSTELTAMISSLIAAPGQREDMSKRSQMLFESRFADDRVYTGYARHVERLGEMRRAQHTLASGQDHN